MEAALQGILSGQVPKALEIVQQESELLQVRGEGGGIQVPKRGMAIQMHEH